MSEVTTWETRDGREIPIAELADGHLINILRKLWRDRESLAFRGKLCTALGMEAYARGAPDGASLAVEDEIRELEDESAESWLERHPQFAALAAEAQKRGLQWKP